MTREEAIKRVETVREFIATNEPKEITRTMLIGIVQSSEYLELLSDLGVVETDDIDMVIAATRTRIENMSDEQWDEFLNNQLSMRNMFKQKSAEDYINELTANIGEEPEIREAGLQGVVEGFELALKLYKVALQYA